jgi:hypothetical protein
MKRFFVVIALAALLGQALAAQDSGEPSESSVLEAARSKYWGEQSTEEKGREAKAAHADSRDDEEDVPFAPFLISFVPGLSIPFGYSDAAFSAGAIGVLTRDVYGFQTAGVFCLARDVAGFQWAGVFNVSEGQVGGFQGAGVFNVAEGDVDGFQGAGVFNVAEGSADGFQGAGVFNIAESSKTLIQTAGVFNIAGDIDGFQMAGVFNQAGRVEGGQIAGVVNVAGDVDGIQIGLVNIADRVDGLQLGLVNIARSPGLSSEGIFFEPETDYVYAAFQAGSRHLYSVFSAGTLRGDGCFGLQPESAGDLVLGYGFGSRMRLSNVYIDLDVSAVSFVGPDLPAIGNAIADWRPMPDASGLIPYPSIRLYLGLPLIGRLHLVGGIKTDVDLAIAPRVPGGLKRGMYYADTWLDVGFQAWTKWYVGIKF